jgi:hypothetical protein
MTSRLGRRLTAVAALFAVLFSSGVTAATAKTARNYCCDYSKWGCGSATGAAVAARTYQQKKSYTVYNYYNVNSSNVYFALQLESIVLASSHSGAGNMIFNNNGSCTCITSNFAYPSGHGHSIKNDFTGKVTTFACADQRKIRSIPTSYGYGAGPCRLVMWQGCYSYKDPDGSGSQQSLTWAGYYEGIYHNAGFTSTIFMDSAIGSFSSDFATGYWKSLAAGNYTNAAMDAGVSYVKSQHMNISGGYETHDYDGGNTKI